MFVLPYYQFSFSISRNRKYLQLSQQIMYFHMHVSKNLQVTINKLYLKNCPCRFGVRIVLLYPPACRKRQLKGGALWCSLVVTFAAIKLQGPRFKPRPRQKFETRFLLHVHPCSASGTTTLCTNASPKSGNSPKR